ncbi:MAG: tetraacyldisaccharide 4'-kinase [Croceivirga sp.]
MAWPISILYGLVVYLRNRLYDLNLLKSTSFDVPIVCIGNLSVGGTGKTPMIEFLILKLQGSFELAVLSRGYKRKSKGFQMADKNSTVTQLGDEPFQIYRKFPSVNVAVDVDRTNGVGQLNKIVHPDIILLDDAFQHRKIKPSLSILLTTYDLRYDKDTYLPTGSLRDSKYAAERADIIVVTKCRDTITQDEMTVITNEVKSTESQQVLFSTLVYDNELCSKDDVLSLDHLKGSFFTLVTGIAKPGPLVKFLRDKDLKFEHLAFADHHNFSSSEITLLQSKTLLITTEKDYVRLKDSLENLYYIKVAHQFLANGEAVLLEAIQSMIKSYH